MSFRTFSKRFLPQSLLGRTLLILVSPLVLLQVVSTYVFFASHWDTMSRRLTDGLVGDIAASVEFLRRASSDHEREAVLKTLGKTTSLTLVFSAGTIMHNQPLSSETDDSQFAQLLARKVNLPFNILEMSEDRDIVVEIQLGEGVLRVEASRKRLFSSTVWVVVLWMVGTSFLLFGIATVFMRNQIRAVRRLAVIAEGFGKGRDVPDLKPSGAVEVRQVAIAFNQMRERIKRQIAQRTEMLAGVSHDLRTPLTRMKLQLALLGSRPGTAELQEDIRDMEQMIEAYLSFARGEGGEAFVKTDLVSLVEEIIARLEREGKTVGFEENGRVMLSVRPLALGRALANLIGNAARYATNITVSIKRSDEFIDIIIDDDGPGIPEDKREEVFKAFLRLDRSRNPATGGVGLGMTVARDLVRGMGGDVILQDSPSGGLRVLVRLPV